MPIEIGRPLSLVRAGRYTDPGDAAAIIGDCYGDLTIGGIAGPCPAVLIDQATFTYAAAAHPVDAITAVYIGPVLQSTGFTLNLANDYQGQGEIATITFAAQPDDAVTWRGRGKLYDAVFPDLEGTLIVNAISQLADLLFSRAAFPLSVVDLPSWRAAAEIVERRDYRTAWVVHDERDIAAWIQEILFNVMGRAAMRADGTIVLSVDDGGALPDASALVAHVVASRDCVDGDEGVTCTGQHESLVNALDLFYLQNWAGGTPSSLITTTGDAMREAVVSRGVHGEARKTMTLRGLRRAADLLTWSEVLYRRQSFAERTTGARVEFSVESPVLAHAGVGDFIGFTWTFGPRRPGNLPYRNQVLQLLNLGLDPMRGGRTVVTALDTGQALETDDVLL